MNLRYYNKWFLSAQLSPSLCDQGDLDPCHHGEDSGRRMEDLGPCHHYLQGNLLCR
jgi:hypothetical protein